MKYVVFKDKLFIPHIQIEGTETWVPLENVKLLFDLNDDPSKVTVPTLAKVINIINEMKSLTANTRWYSIIETNSVLPTAAELRAVYESTEPSAALIVKEVGTDKIVALSQYGKTVDYEMPDETIVPLSTVQADINDGILYTVEPTGVFETAIMTANGLQIDNSKDFIPSEISRLGSEILALGTEITKLQDSLTGVIARLSDQGIFITQANLKDIQGKGTIALSGTPSEPNKIPTRAEVGSMGAQLNNLITQTQTDASAARVAASTAQTNANDALTKATDADHKATSMSTTVTTAAQDAHDAKIAAAKANDGLTQEVAARKAEDLVLDGKIAANAAKITTNTQTIAANKAILDTVKAQADLDHQDLATNIKPGLTATTHVANEALSYGQDWNTSKGQVAMKSELDVKAVIELKGRPITKAGTNSYKIDFGAWNGNPALDLTGISNGVKAIINIHRTTQTDPVQNRYNDLIDQHYNDATSDGTCTIYLADSLTTLEKTQYTATVVVSNTQATFSLNKADGTAANLNAAQEAVILAYQAVTITFEGTNTQSVSAGDDVARGQIVSLTQTVNSNTAAIAGKQAALTTAQLAVVNGEAFTTTIKTRLSGIANVKVKVNTTDEEKYLENVVSGEILAGKDYVDAKVASAGVPATVTTDLTQLKNIKVQGKGIPSDLPASQTTLSELTSADVLASASYVADVVGAKQDSTITAIAGATTVVGALTAINTVATQAKSAVDAIDLTVKQNSTDNALTTTSKTIPGAINEINAWKTSATTELAKLNLDDTNLLALEALVA